jgi:hypothetical protein
MPSAHRCWNTRASTPNAAAAENRLIAIDVNAMTMDRNVTVITRNVSSSTHPITQGSFCAWWGGVVHVVGGVAVDGVLGARHRTHRHGDACPRRPYGLLIVDPGRHRDHVHPPIGRRPHRRGVARSGVAGPVDNAGQRGRDLTRVLRRRPHDYRVDDLPIDVSASSTGTPAAMIAPNATSRISSVRGMLMTSDRCRSCASC